MYADVVTTDVDVAAARLATGGLVAIPTETVYGLAADATDPVAVARIFEVKARPRDHPLIVHLAGADQLRDWASSPSDTAFLLAHHGWPGPLTIIVPRSGAVLDVVTGGRDTVGLRVPAHPLARALIERTGPLAAPSANRYGGVSPTTAQHVFDDLANLLDPDRDVILDGGACPIGVESTIVDCVSDPPQVLRPGAVTHDQVQRLLDARLAPAAGPTRASGMRSSHYAPRCAVRLVDDLDDAIAMRAGTPGAEIMEQDADLAVAARDLYGRLRDADERGVATLIIVLPPAEGLGYAIRDRLAKAAAPR
jgi:L-threonylcarbamoyladenylate synthase